MNAAEYVSAMIARRLAYIVNSTRVILISPQISEAVFINSRGNWHPLPTPLAQNGKSARQ